MTRLFLLLFLPALCMAAEPNQPDFNISMFASHWLEWVTVDSKWESGPLNEYWFDALPNGNTRTRIVVKAESGTIRVQWLKQEMFNLKQWNEFARNFRPLVRPDPDPNEILAGITDPNLLEAVKELLGR